MYNLIYIIPFNSKDGNSYKIEISQDGATGSPIELIGGVSPFTIEYNGEDFLYNPSKLCGATIRLVGDNINLIGSDKFQQLFSTNYQQFKVNLKRNDSIIWTGFINPEVYSQDFSHSVYDFEIECISALSTLQYIDFKKTTDSVNIMDLIEECIAKSKGDYQHCYIPQTYNIDLQLLVISAYNFIDEDDKPMNYKEILESICTFLNWTIAEYEGNIYFIDVDYIAKGLTEYTDILTRGYPTVNLSNSIELTDVKSMGASNTLSILGGYNQATVIASDYEVDNDRLFPEFDFKPISENDKVKFEKDKQMYVKYFCFTPENYTFYYYTLVITYTGEIKQYTWRESTANEIEQNNTEHNLAGAYAVKTTNYDVENKPSKLTYTDEIELRQTYKSEDNVIMSEFVSLYDFKLLETNFDDSYVVIDSQYKLAINFEMGRCVNVEHLMYDIGQKDSDSEEIVVNVPVALSFGNYYYNGSTWQDSFCKFIIRVIYSPSNFNNSYVSCENTNTFENNVDELSGYIINIDRVLQGQPNLTIYSPENTTEMITPEGHARSYFIKDLSIECQRIGSDSLFGEEEKQDTKYTNVVNEKYINECDDITFYITTKNESELSLSKVIYNNEILDKISNNITNSESKPEELMIQRIVNQYKQPKFKLSAEIEPVILPYSIVTEKYLSGKKFIFGGGTIDYLENNANYNLIEIN
jgi:hypothetical protein